MNELQSLSQIFQDKICFFFIQQVFLRKLATEYVILGKECEAEGMLPAAKANYEKALELCPEHTEAARRLKKLAKNSGAK